MEQVNGRLKNALLKINCARETEERETSNVMFSIAVIQHGRFIKLATLY